MHLDPFFPDSGVVEDVKEVERRHENNR
jgi:hypothetical protein